jgi:predicted glycosyltransferase
VRFDGFLVGEEVGREARPAGSAGATVAPVPPSQGARNGSPRFLLYSHDALGLGHVRRNLVIADALIARNPSASVILATSAEHADSLGVPDGVDLVRLPSVRKVANGRYTPRRLRIPAADMTDIRAGIMDAAVASYRPDVLLVDKQPLGAGDELRTALVRLRMEGGRAVLGLRDVLDDPAGVRAEWTPTRTSVVLEHYGRILVYGRESVFDTLRRSGLPAELGARTRYCGYVTAQPIGDGTAARTIRSFRSGARSRPIVLGTTGGGEDGQRVLEAFVEAAAGAPWDAIAVTGPQLDAAAARAFRHRAAAAGVAVRTFVPELAGWFGVVDAVVCMGGYNTLAEALVRGAPTVCVPRTAPRREQLIRARALEDLDLLGVVELDSVCVQVLREAIDSALTRSRRTIARAAESALGFGGADVAAESLLAEAALSSAGAAR